MNKKWFEVIDFYRLTGLVCIWISSWIFMIPWKADITSPYFDNFWGALFAFFGAAAKKTATIQQTPDLICGIFALCVIVVLNLRGILNIADNSKFSEQDLKEHKLLIVCLNILSIIVHTLFFTLLIKIFLFPDKGDSAIMSRLKQNFGVTIFAAVCITGMILGSVSISKILLIIFSFVTIFLNVSFVSSTMGAWGFVAILLAAIGFYLEFCFDSFNKKNLAVDLALLAGRYDKLELKASEESEKMRSEVKNFAKSAIKAEKLGIDKK